MSSFDHVDLPLLPKSPMAREIIELVGHAESPALANHSYRSFLFARLAADARGLAPSEDYDPQLLFTACLLHDIGLTSEGNRGQRFEVNGADVAADLLGRYGRSWRDIDAVWQAIALNTSIGIAQRRGQLAELTLTGVAIDFGEGAEVIPDSVADAIHRAYPRLSVARELTDAVVRYATGTPGAAPPFSMAAELVRQHGVHGQLSTLEVMARSSRWGDG